MNLFNSFALVLWLFFILVWFAFTAFSVYKTKKDDGAREAQQILFPFFAVQTAFSAFGVLLCMIKQETVFAYILTTAMTLISCYFTAQVYLNRPRFD